MKANTILIADDDAGILEALSMILTDAGYVAKTTVSGEGLLELEELPDLILLDLWMSGTDGRDVCHLLKQQPRTRHIPIIIISAHQRTRLIAAEIGADDYLQKPFEMSLLLHKIRLYLNR